jgi:glucosamine--fructose-6-phosphate aminotransferase (isomerizing)
LALITLLIGRERELSLEEGQAIARDLARLPELARAMLADTSAIEAIAKKYARYEHMMFIGRHIHAPIAAEGALKLKEVAYVHAEAYPGGELKHGPLALLSPDVPVLAIVPEDIVYEKMLSNMQEAKARSAPIIALTTHGAIGEVENIANDVIFVPKVHPMLQPILMTIPLQLLAYYAGVGKGYNVDRPRNLAKSVTVE